MDRCVKCGAGLGAGRFCLNCGHPIGVPTPADATTRTARVPAERHRSAAEHARRLQDPPQAPPAEPASDRSGGPGEPDDGWLLPGRPVDDEPSRLHWAAWVLAALALVAAALFGLSYLDERTGDGAADRDSGRAGTTGGSGAGDRGRAGSSASPAGPAVDVARKARVEVPATAPRSTELNGSPVSFEAGRMVDGSRRTAWRMPGDGTGAEITFVLDGPAEISQVGLVNGYARKVADVDWYPKHRRIRAVTWTFDDGTSVEQVLEDRRRLQRLDVDPVRTRTVTLTLTRVTIPGSGSFARDYTAISTVSLMGQPVG